MRDIVRASDYLSDKTQRNRLSPAASELANTTSQADGQKLMKANDSKCRCIVATVLICLSLFAVRSANGSPQQHYYRGQVPTNPPSISADPVSVTIVPGQRATFTVTAQGNLLHYLWMRNGVPILGATSASYTTPTATVSDNGAQFTVRVSNRAGVASSDAATLTVTSGSAQLRLSLSTLNFSSVEIGGNSSLSVTVTNSGSSSATILSVTVSGSGFSATGLSGVILSPGQSTTENVMFAPSGSGNFVGSVAIVSDAANSAATINLSGTGVQPTTASITVRPANQTISPGSQVQFKATDSLGNDITDSVIWATSDSSIVSITATGLAMGVAYGVVTISATE